MLQARKRSTVISRWVRNPLIDAVPYKIDTVLTDKRGAVLRHACASVRPDRTISAARVRPHLSRAWIGAKRLKSLRALTSYEHICKAWADRQIDFNVEAPPSPRRQGGILRHIHPSRPRNPSSGELSAPGIAPPTPWERHTRRPAPSTWPSSPPEALTGEVGVLGGFGAKASQSRKDSKKPGLLQNGHRHGFPFLLT